MDTNEKPGKPRRKSGEPKRKNGEGSITYRESDKRWMIRYQDETMDKPIVAYLKGENDSKGRDRAKLLLHDKIKAQQEGTYMQKNNITLGEWIENKWLPVVQVKKELSNNFYLRKLDLYRLHIKSADIGKIPLQRLKEMDIDRFYADLLDHGKEVKTKNESGETIITYVGLSAQTVRHIHNIVKPALRYAVKNKIIPDNPAEEIKPPIVGPKEYVILKEDEIGKYLKALYNHRLYALFVLAMCTGMRRAELLGLRWTDIDFETRILHIRQGVQRVRNENGSSALENTGVKTEKSERNIVLPLLAITELKAHHVKQEKEVERILSSQKSRERYHDEGLIFSTIYGGKMEPRRIWDAHTKALKDAELVHIPFHNLRHTVATLLLQKGENAKTIQELLGHTQIRTTLDIYTHVLKDMKAATAERLDGIISGSLLQADQPNSSPVIPE